MLCTECLGKSPLDRLNCLKCGGSGAFCDGCCQPVDCCECGEAEDETPERCPECGEIYRNCWCGPSVNQPWTKS